MYLWIYIYLRCIFGFILRFSSVADRFRVLTFRRWKPPHDFGGVGFHRKWDGVDVKVVIMQSIEISQGSTSDFVFCGDVAPYV